MIVWWVSECPDRRRDPRFLDYVAWVFGGGNPYRLGDLCNYRCGPEYDYNFEKASFRIRPGKCPYEWDIDFLSIALTYLKEVGNTGCPTMEKYLSSNLQRLIETRHSQVNERRSHSEEILKYLKETGALDHLSYGERKELTEELQRVDKILT
jgi:hypothetical protein